MIAAIGSILASIFRRDWACVAFVALARNRVDERLQMRLTLLLLLDRLADQRLLLAALPLEAGVAAAPQGQFASVEMQDAVGDVVKKIAVVADDQDRRRAILQIVVSHSTPSRSR